MRGDRRLPNRLRQGHVAIHIPIEMELTDDLCRFVLRHQVWMQFRTGALLIVAKLCNMSHRYGIGGRKPTVHELTKKYYLAIID